MKCLLDKNYDYSRYFVVVVGPPRIELGLSDFQSNVRTSYTKGPLKSNYPRKIILPLVKSYGVISTVTLSPMIKSD